MKLTKRDFVVATLTAGLTVSVTWAGVTFAQANKAVMGS